jgi:hypothetical protein
MNDYLRAITVKQVIVTLAIVIPWATTLWNATDWIIRPVLAGAIVEVLKDEGINLQEQSKKIDQTAKDVEELKAATDEQTKLLKQILEQQKGEQPQ